MAVLKTGPLPGSGGGTNATVTVGPVTADDNFGRYSTDAVNSNQIFSDYAIQSRYEKDGHIYMMGLTSTVPFNGDSVGFVQLANPTLLWVVDWTAQRTGEKPGIPNPYPSGSSNWILLDDFYEPYMETIASDAVTPIWRISGTYIYGNRNPSDTTVDDINFTRPPWLVDDQDRSVSDSLFTTGLITDGEF